jgi:hypothetical protein
MAKKKPAEDKKMDYKDMGKKAKATKPAAAPPAMKKGRGGKKGC